MTGDILFMLLVSFVVKLAYAAGRRRGAIEVTSVLLDTDGDF